MCRREADISRPIGPVEPVSPAEVDTSPSSEQLSPEQQSQPTESGNDPSAAGTRPAGAQQESPRHASRPSLTATAAMTRAAIGSAHDQPNRLFERQSDQQDRGQVGAEQGLLGVGDR